MPNLAETLRLLRDEARREPGHWAQRNLLSLELWWKIDRGADLLALSRTDRVPSDQEVDNCSSTLPAGLAVAHRFDYPTKRLVRLVLARRCSECKGVIDDNAKLYADGTKCSPCRLGHPKTTPCAGECGAELPYDPTYGDENRCTRCAMDAGRKDPRRRPREFRA